MERKPVQRKLNEQVQNLRFVAQALAETCLRELFWEHDRKAGLYKDDCFILSRPSQILLKNVDQFVMLYEQAECDTTGTKNSTKPTVIIIYAA